MAFGNLLHERAEAGADSAVGFGSQKRPKPSAAFSIIEAESHLAVVSVDEVAFAVGASGKVLNRIDTAHIGFDHRHEINFFVFTELAQGKLCSADAYGQSWTRMSME
jgi:hypothetical protein